MEITLTIKVEVPAGTDPQRVADDINSALDEEDGNIMPPLVWADWTVGAALVTAVRP